MIFKNDLVVIDETTYRLLETDAARDLAWVIDINDRLAQPRRVVWSTISGLQAMYMEPQSIPEARLSDAALKARDRAQKVVWPLLDRMQDLYDENMRSHLLKKHSKMTGVSLPTLYKWLRMYWQGGQCESALLPSFSRCGRAEGSVTAGRGPKRQDGASTYQLVEEDLRYFEQSLKNHYLKDERVQLTQTYDYRKRSIDRTPCAVSYFSRCAR